MWRWLRTFCPSRRNTAPTRTSKKSCRRQFLGSSKMQQVMLHFIPKRGRYTGRGQLVTFSIPENVHLVDVRYPEQRNPSICWLPSSCNLYLHVRSSSSMLNLLTYSKDGIKYIHSIYKLYPDHRHHYVWLPLTRMNHLSNTPFPTRLSRNCGAFVREPREKPAWSIHESSLVSVLWG